MFVKDFMTKDLITVQTTQRIGAAVDLMNQNKIHRLPVVDTKEKLIGLVTESVIAESSPSNATSLSVFEMNYLLNKTTVGDVMITNVKTIGPNALLEDAVDMMRKNHINVLPVVDGEKLVGIITNNDIFDAFLEITGYNSDGVRVAIQIKQDQKGVLARLTKIFFEAQINIVQIVVYREIKEQPIVVVQVTGQDADDVRALLTENDFDVMMSLNTSSSEE
ncbi:CBS domain-containing protein [Bavariicoccus seileri]|uniref:CBS domain-containing protein n=1 Tax=Bavariicoccus seileri TaxID=549685 RepID=UPI003F93888C